MGGLSPGRWAPDPHSHPYNNTQHARARVDAAIGMSAFSSPTYINSVFLYKLNKKTGTYAALQTHSLPTDSGFGYDVAFSKTGKTLAVGAIGYDIPSGNTQAGALYIFGGTMQVRNGAKKENGCAVMRGTSFQRRDVAVTEAALIQSRPPPHPLSFISHKEVSNAHPRQTLLPWN
jgi:hypothetical protein